MMHGQTQIGFLFVPVCNVIDSIGLVPKVVLSAIFTSMGFVEFSH